MIKRIFHVGLAVKNLDSAIKFLEGTYGAKVLLRKTFQSQKMESALISLSEVKFEVVCSLDPDGVIGKFIQDRGEGIHHISLEVDDMDRTIQELRGKGLTVVGETVTEEGKFAFVHPQNNLGVLMELYQQLG